MKTRRKKLQRKKRVPTQLLIVAGVLALVGLVLVLKSQQPGSHSASAANSADTAPAAAGTPARVVPSAPPNTLPEEQFDQWLAQGKPMLAFFHSNTCVQCVQMTEIVGQVYPGFAHQVALVDVNVYDRRNASLLRRAGIRVIPTLIFIDHTGSGQGFSGVMTPDALRNQLASIAQE